MVMRQLVVCVWETARRAVKLFSRAAPRQNVRLTSRPPECRVHCCGICRRRLGAARCPASSPKSERASTPATATAATSTAANLATATAAAAAAAALAGSLWRHRLNSLADRSNAHNAAVR